MEKAGFCRAANSAEPTTQVSCSWHSHQGVMWEEERRHGGRPHHVCLQNMFLLLKTKLATLACPSSYVVWNVPSHNSEL